MKVFFSILIILIALFSELILAPGQVKEPFIYNDRGKRDPMVPLVDKDGRYLLSGEEFYSFSNLRLSGILWDPLGKSSALINNQIIKVGESIWGFKVINITKDSVTFFKDGKDYIIRLSEEKEGE